MQGSEKKAAADYSKRREREVYDTRFATKGQKKGTKK